MTQVMTKPSGKRAGASAAREQRRLERRCETLRMEIHALERARAELCSVLSHDLRNPLTVILWSTQMLGKSLPGEAGARRNLDAIGRASEEMSQMLHDLSDAARIPDGRLQLSRASGDVAALVEQSVAASRTLAQTKQLTLAVEIEPKLGPVRWDRDRMARVLGGLVSNAVRITPKGGSIAVRAERFVESGREGVRLSVEDRGPGIPADQRASLFDLPAAPQPGAPGRARVQSPGVALFVAQGVVEAHGGRIWVESEPGQGSKFVMALPAE